MRAHLDEVLVPAPGTPVPPRALEFTSTGGTLTAAATGSTPDGQQPTPPPPQQKAKVYFGPHPEEFYLPKQTPVQGHDPVSHVL